MADKIGQYRRALLNLGQERIASLSEASSARYALDDAYDEDTKLCLESGFWNFAMRVVQVDSSASVTPAFGYTYAFTKPTDFIRLLSMSNEETMTAPLMDFVDEPNYWFANTDPLYSKYVSDDTAYGLDLSIWPESFARYHSFQLAVSACKRITGSDPSDGLEKKLKSALANARSKDAMNEPPKYPPTGTWVRSRNFGNSSTRWDRSSR